MLIRISFNKLFFIFALPSPIVFLLKIKYLRIPDIRTSNNWKSQYIAPTWSSYIYIYTLLCWSHCGKGKQGIHNQFTIKPGYPKWSIKLLNSPPPTTFSQNNRSIKKQSWTRDTWPTGIRWSTVQVLDLWSLHSKPQRSSWITAEKFIEKFGSHASTRIINLRRRQGATIQSSASQTRCIAV